jgi:phosphoribosylformylglycinamidine synthase
VIPRPALLEQQGHAVEHALRSLGIAGVQQVRVGKANELGIDAPDAAAAEAEARRMCEQFLANPVTEDFVVAVEA